MGRGRAQAWEESCGAASRPLPEGYHRREPEKTVLHRVVREQLETQIALLRQDGPGIPRHVERELRGYLRCGLLGEGFARVVCSRCGEEILVAFSCKGRGVCPSCCARRMSDTAAHLVDRVLPVAPYRQWVLSYPKRLRLLFARDAKAASQSARIFLSEVFRWQRHKARRLGFRRPKVGAVSFTQRFGSKLDLNVHHHALLPDGVFAEGDEGLSFARLEAPTDEELARILLRVVKRTWAMVRMRGLWDEEPVDALAQVQSEALQTGFLPAIEVSTKAHTAFLEGFSLHAGAHVHEHDRQGLEHLARYGLRPAVSMKRLRLLADGRVELRMRRPMWDGTTAVAFAPGTFVRRLMAIVPPPRLHLTRYFGVFAPASKVRPTLVQPRRAAFDARAPALPSRPLVEPPPASERSRRLDWSALLARVFEQDVLRCPCGGRRKVTAFMPEGKTAHAVLEQLGIDATAPPIAKAKLPPRQEWLDLPDGHSPDYAA